MCILWYYRRSYALMSPVLSFDFDECYSQGKSLALWEVNMKVASFGISVGSVLTLFCVGTKDTFLVNMFSSKFAL